ncbi:MAG: DUF4262 domain-containing protein [Methylobacterium sp.]|uniref:DUF4262 domain-containing protein n=1 Tax=Methylobacterium sp. TaxID=409 RepID=UPI0025DDF618|nr:DUF4262 domain-containing protein [Methylobacterium sp.]MBX9934014.1 DUF4262 domain-containing protein [Methylobacterium sp.]
MTDRSPEKHSPVVVRSFQNRDELWSHTVGMIDRGLPELLVSGLDQARGRAILMNAAHDVLDRAGVVDGDLSTRIADRNVMFRSLPVERAGLYALEAANRDPQQFHALQVVWPDEEGLFPWSSGCDPEVVRSQSLFVDLEPPSEAYSPRMS